jgi:hypothetical protein
MEFQRYSLSKGASTSMEGVCCPLLWRPQLTTGQHSDHLYTGQVLT